MDSIFGTDEKVLHGGNVNDNLVGDENPKVLISLAEEGRGLNPGNGDDALYLRVLETDMFCRLWHD